MHRRAGSHSADTRSRPASGRRPNTVGKPLRWRTSTGIRAKFSETTGEAPTYTTSCGRLKQPDKQKLPWQLTESPVLITPSINCSGRDSLGLSGPVAYIGNSLFRRIRHVQQIEILETDGSLGYQSLANEVPHLAPEA